MRNHGPEGGDGGGGWQPEPVAVLPEQFFRSRYDLSALRPEQCLGLAVLEISLFDYARGASGAKGAGLREFREADRWLAASDHRWPFSFVNLCDALGINATRLRARLWQWRAEVRARGVMLRGTPRRMRRITGGRPRKIGGRSLLRDLE